MPDTRVVSLTFGIVTPENVSYQNAPPIDVDADQFKIRLADGIAVVTMKEHHPTVDSAMAVVRPYLDAWECGVALEKGRREMRFRYADAAVVDLSPPVRDTMLIVQNMGQAQFAGSLQLAVSWRTYPEPPDHFVASEDVQTLVQRWERCASGNDTLLSTAYFCYTMLVWIANGRTIDAKGRLQMDPTDVPGKFAVSGEVLDTLRKLASSRGDLLEARKLGRGSKVSPLTPEESHWLRVVILRLIHRVGEVEWAMANGQPLSALNTITISDLPALPRS